MLTVQCIFDSAQAGDTLYIEGQTISAKIDVDMNGAAHASPTLTNPIYVYGVNSSGVVLTGSNQATITTGSAISALCSLAVVSDFFRWSNVRFDGGGNAKATCCIVGPGEGPDGWVWRNCRFTNASVHNINIKTTNTVNLPWTFTRCEIDNAGKSGTGNGFNNITASRTPGRFFNCSIHDNDSIGIMIGSTAVQVLRNCLFFNNGNIAVKSTGVSEHFIDNCVFYGNGSDALNLAQNAIVSSFTNNVGMSNVGYFINTNTSDLSYWKAPVVMNNCTYNNGNVIDINGGALPGVGNITTDPGFVSVTDGSEDFNVTGTAKNAGVNPYGY
jgi:hypothetical protein